MGCRTEPAIVHIDHVLQKLHFFFQFSNFFCNYTAYRKKKIHDFPVKEKLHDMMIFFNT